MKKTSLIIISLLLASCSTPTPGPDKTIAGAVLGATWGAGAGAVIGNQIEDTPRVGEGAAVGAGFGLISGALQGAGYDVIESDQIRQEKELENLKIQNIANTRQLAMIQAELDYNTINDVPTSVYDVYFDIDATNLKSGAIASLEKIADAIMNTPRVSKVNVYGHSDESGNENYNQKLAEARANNVSSYLAKHGISYDKINVESFGSEMPIATNSTVAGRQLNRRVEVSVEIN